MRYPREIFQICKLAFCNEFQSGLEWAAIDFQVWAGHYVIQKTQIRLKNDLALLLNPV